LRVGAWGERIGDKRRLGFILHGPHRIGAGMLARGLLGVVGLAVESLGEHGSQAIGGRRLKRLLRLAGLRDQF
jgi:hypothetical protein